METGTQMPFCAISFTLHYGSFSNTLANAIKIKNKELQLKKKIWNSLRKHGFPSAKTALLSKPTSRRAYEPRWYLRFSVDATGHEGAPLFISLVQSIRALQSSQGDLYWSWLEREIGR